MSNLDIMINNLREDVAEEFPDILFFSDYRGGKFSPSDLADLKQELSKLGVEMSSATEPGYAFQFKVAFDNLKGCEVLAKHLREVFCYHDDAIILGDTGSDNETFLFYPFIDRAKPNFEVKDGIVTGDNIFKGMKLNLENGNYVIYNKALVNLDED